MITINRSELIAHLHTKFASRQLTSRFGMGCATSVCSLALFLHLLNLSKREVLWKVISDERHTNANREISGASTVSRRIFEFTNFLSVGSPTS